MAAPVSRRVGLAAGVGVRFDEDCVVQVLEAGGEGAGHGEVPQDVGGPEQVERGAAGPALSVAQRDGHERRRDGSLNLGAGPVRAEIHGGQGCGDRSISLSCGPVGHEGIGYGLVHCSGVAVAGELGVRVVFGLHDAGDEVEGHFRLREVVGQGSRDGVVGLLTRVIPA